MTAKANFNLTISFFIAKLCDSATFQNLIQFLVYQMQYWGFYTKERIPTEDTYSLSPNCWLNYH